MLGPRDGRIGGLNIVNPNEAITEMLGGDDLQPQPLALLDRLDSGVVRAERGTSGFELEAGDVAEVGPEGLLDVGAEAKAVGGETGVEFGPEGGEGEAGGAEGADFFERGVDD